MAFCGQCGFQLPPRVINCPRCGAATEHNVSMEESHPNDPTVAMLPTLDAFPGQSTQSTQPAQWSAVLPTVPVTPVPPVPPAPPTPPQHQQLVLRPDGSGYDATQISGAPTYQASMTPPPATSQPGVGTSYPSYPGYAPTSGANYPTQGRDISSPGFQIQQAQSSPGYMAPDGAVYQPIPNSFGVGQQAPQKRGKGGLIALFVLLAILIVGGAAGAFVLKQQGILFNNGTGTGTGTATTGTGTATGTGTGAGQTATAIPSPTPSPTPFPSPTPSPTSVPLTQQAQTLVQNYYDNINNKNYSASYALLGSQMQQQQQSYSQYQAGFADTQQDVITITGTTQQSDGTVRVDVTLQATHTDGTQHTFQGYYTVGPENGSLKILSGHLTQTS